MADWRNRIIAHTVVPGCELRPHPMNVRQHSLRQRNALKTLLDDLGVVQELVIYDSPKHGGLVVIDGHLRREEGLDYQWPCTLLDVDDEEAEALLLTLDQLARMATTDRDVLAALADRVSTQRTQLREMLAQLVPRARRPEDLPPDDTEAVMLDLDCVRDATDALVPGAPEVLQQLLDAGYRVTVTFRTGRTTKAEVRHWLRTHGAPSTVLVEEVPDHRLWVSARAIYRQPDNLGGLMHVIATGWRTA